MSYLWDEARAAELAGVKWHYSSTGQLTRSRLRLTNYGGQHFLQDVR
jgi:hypothetical protein